MNPTAQERLDKYMALFHKLFNGAGGVAVLESSRDATLALLNRLPEPKVHYAYAPGKWTVAGVIQHIIDTERILSYRALCFARGEALDLPPFEEDEYAALSQPERRTLHSLHEEYAAVRHSTLCLYHSFSPEMLARAGAANGLRVTPEQYALFIAGHNQHHLNTLEERYGV